VDIPVAFLRVRDDTGQIAGTALLHKPAVGMAVLARIAAMGDLRHFKRMEHVAKPGRRPAGVLFADLESSSALARRLSTAGYFTLVRRLARAADECVVDAGGLVGTHAGDGVVAFFLAESTGSESAAARACITAARAIRDAVPDIAARCEVNPDDVVMRFGLHWGANLYVGQITTKGRTEVTALGDQVNETARIEACATGGRALASKDLLERLDRDDAAALDLDPDHITYTALANLSTTTEKARRDAPAVSVIEI
jgi:class 3 adenylate cyclase